MSVSNESLVLLARDLAMAFGRYAERGGRPCGDDCPCPLNQARRGAWVVYDMVMTGQREALLDLLRRRVRDRDTPPRQP
jgi:hypothetical protein